MGTQLYGPSGAAVWSAPTIDVQRQVLYVATGDNYSDPPSETSDAILAFELATGRLSGIGRLPQTTPTSRLASLATAPTVRKATVRTTTLVNRRSW